MAKKAHEDELVKNFLKEESKERFLELFMAYRPMILKAIGKYHFNFFDTDDLIQEARIVCYQTAQAFKQNASNSYGAFFKRSLLNRYCSLLRYENARKRCSENKISLDEMIEKIGDGVLIEDKVDNDKILHISESIEKLPVILSELEYNIFQLKVIYGYGVEESAKHLDIPKRQAYNALSRVRIKIGKILKEDF